MANCSICGKKLGFMDGGREPYTGHELLVCNGCGVFFKQLDLSIKNLNEEEFDKCKEELNQLGNKRDLGEAIKEYLQQADGQFERKKEEEEKRANLSAQLLQEDRICPICRRRINQGQTTCEFCGYSLKEIYLSRDQKQKILANKQAQIEKNPFYEYKVETIRDSMFTGEMKGSILEDLIMQYALNGWKLHSIVSNELGKNAILGINATVDQFILIFERCIKPQE